MDGVQTSKNALYKTCVYESIVRRGWLAEPITAHRLLQWNSNRPLRVLERRLDL
jgi:hypothetical protein